MVSSMLKPPIELYVKSPPLTAQFFSIVVEATGSPKILEDAINYVRRGGKLV